MAKVVINRDVYVRNKYGVLRRVFVGGSEADKIHVAAIEADVKRGELDYFDFENNKVAESPFAEKEPVVEKVAVEEPVVEVAAVEEPKEAEVVAEEPVKEEVAEAVVEEKKSKKK